MEAVDGVPELVEIVNNSQIQRRKEYSHGKDHFKNTSRKPFIVVEGLDGTGRPYYYVKHLVNLFPWSKKNYELSSTFQEKLHLSSGWPTQQRVRFSLHRLQ